MYFYMDEFIVSFILINFLSLKVIMMRVLGISSIRICG